MSEQQPTEVHALSWDELKPYEKDQGGYWLHGRGDKTWVAVPNPEHVRREAEARAALGAASEREADAGMALWQWLQGSSESKVAAIRQYRYTVLASRALAAPWSEFDESTPPRDRIMGDMRELTAIADPDHRARRHVRTSQNLDAYRDEQAAARLADLLAWQRAYIEAHPETGTLDLIEATAKEMT